MLALDNGLQNDIIVLGDDVVKAASAGSWETRRGGYTADTSAGRSCSIKWGQGEADRGCSFTHIDI